MSAIYRYPGIQPFSQTDRSVFFGRDDDIAILYNSILLNQSTVLVGKSGIGKTSLIYAGIKPLIEEKINTNPADKRCIMFAPVRIGSWSPKDTETLMDKLRGLQFDENESTQESKPLASFLDPSLRGSLWFRLKQLQYSYRLNKREVTHLIIFDQLEEIFTYPHHQFNELLVQLKEVVSTNLPDSIRLAIEDHDVENNNLLTDDEYEILYSSVPVKFLFAIRSDKLSLMMRLRHVLPDLLQQSYEIRPLTKLQAKKAIMEPANLPGFPEKYITDAFTIADATASYITDFLFDLPDYDLENNFEEYKIEPFTLQIICTHIERKVAPTDEDRIINIDEIPQPQNIISDYYKTVLTELGLDEQMELKVRVLIEEKMIYEADQRKLILYKEIIIKDYGISEALLTQLTKQRLLREITSTGIKSSYEIGHDWLVIPILMAKGERLGTSGDMAEKIDESLRLLNEQIDKSPGNYLLYQQRASYYNLVNNYGAATADYTKALNLKGTEDVDILLARAYSYMLQKNYTHAALDYENINRLDPHNYLSWYNLGVLNYELQDVSKARTCFLKTIEINPGYSDAFNYIGYMEETDGHKEQAIDYYKKAMAADDGNYRPFYNLGILYNSDKKMEEARECFLQTIAINPDYSNGYYQLGLIESEGNKSKAIEYFNTATQTNPRNYLAYYSLGVLTYEDGNLAGAKDYFLKSIEINPQHGEALNYLGFLENSLGNTEAAVDYYTKAFATDAGYYQPLFNLGILFFNDNKWEEAEKYFLKTVELNPAFSNGWHYLGMIALQKGNKEEEKKYYEKALATDEKSELATNSLGVWYFNTKDLLQAEMYFNKTLEINPANTNAYYNLGLIEADKGNTSGEIDYYLKAIEADKNYVSPKYNLAVTYYQAGEMELAKKYFLEVTDIKPDYSDALNYLGLIEQDFGDTQKAIDFYLKAMSANPDGILPAYNLGILYYRENNLPLSKTYFLKAIEINPAYCAALNYLGLIEVVEDNGEMAFGYFNKAIKAEPGNYRPHYNLGEWYYNQQKFTEAENCFKRVLEILPGYSDALNYLGLLQSKKGENDQALSYYRQSVEADTKNYLPWFNMGVLHYDLNKMEEAKDCFLKTAGLNPQPGDAYNYLGVIEKNEGHKEIALDYFIRATAADSGNVNAAFNRAVIYREQDNFEEAIIYYKQFEAAFPDDWEVHYELGLCYKSSDAGQAMACFKKAQELAPENEAVKTELEAINNTDQMPDNLAIV